MIKVRYDIITKAADSANVSPIVFPLVLPDVPSGTAETVPARAERRAVAEARVIAVINYWLVEHGHRPVDAAEMEDYAAGVTEQPVPARDLTAAEIKVEDAVIRREFADGIDHIPDHIAHRPSRRPVR